MSKLKHRAKQALSVVVAVCLAWGTVVVPGAFAQGGSSGDDTASEPQAAAAESPYTMAATFDGTPLSPTCLNEFTNDWSRGTTKPVSVTLKRDKPESADESKSYVLCIKCSDIFYFAGLPDAHAITGVEEVAMVRNAVPKVNKPDGTYGNLSGFSSYSGEIRLLLNTSVETITVPDIGLSFNPVLAGYIGKTQSVANPLQFSLVSIDGSSNLNGFSTSETQILQSANVDSVALKTESLVGSNLKNTLSTKEFDNDAVNEQNVYIGKEGNITYAGGTAGQSWQLFSSLKVVFNCPYIEVNGAKYYLSLKSDDKALTGNAQGSRTAYKMASDAVYDSAAHTITYSFANVYLGEHTVLFYSPVFSWPEDDAVKDYVLNETDEVKVQGADWEIVEQKSYTDADTTLRSSFTPRYYAYYVPSRPEVVLRSSAEADSNSQIAKREIYKGLTRENGVEGTLGFFDIHNDGALDSPELNVAFESNTGNGDAQYYVTRVNLPGYYADTSRKIEVNYVLSNGYSECSGKVDYSVGEKSGVFGDRGSIACRAADLRKASSVGDDYFIKSLRYSTQLQKGTSYHYETAHLWRNRMPDAGLFFGYIEGEVGAVAYATMNISSGDSGATLNSTGVSTLSSEEKSAIAEDDYIAVNPQAPKFSASASSSSSASTASITAGGSTFLRFSAVVSSEEYYLDPNRVVNGYHVFRDGVFYVALPKGVSISGPDQVTIKASGGSRDVPAERVGQLSGSDFEKDGITASWWVIQASDINAVGDNSSKASFSVSIQLATDISMQSTVWSFGCCMAIQAKDQKLSWAAATERGKVFRSTNGMKNGSNEASIKALGSALELNADSLGLDSSKLQLNIYTNNESATLNISRAEARLDVSTSLQFAGDSQSSTANLKLSDASKQVEYAVTVSSDQGGYAEDFSYYIPIPKGSSAIDAESFVASCEVPLKMSDALEVAGGVAGRNDAGDIPFEVGYTTQGGLTSNSVRSDSVTWVNTPSDWSDVTAVKVATKISAQVKEGASYRFVLKLGCDVDQTALEKRAGLATQWRSFGRYTYVRNNVSTTNTYPSSLNEVAACCVKDLRDSPTVATLDTGADNNYVDVASTVFYSFKKGQALRVKTASAKEGTELVSEEPSALFGSEANSKFRVSFNINNSSAPITAANGQGGGNWNVAASAETKFQARVSFSKALTDTATVRYVDFVVGNDYIDIAWRVRLERAVAPASAEGSGVAVGAHYQVPQVGDSCSIARNSAFTVLFAADNYVPANYSSQAISLIQASGSEPVELPVGTAITMMPVDADSRTESYWQHMVSAGEISIDLSSFTRMAGSDAFSYDTESVSQIALRYMFVIDFSGVDAGRRLDSQTCSVVFRAEPVEGAENSAVDIERAVTLTDGASFALSASTDSVVGSGLEVSLQRTVTKSVANESYLDGKSLSLVVTPQAGGSTLPADAKLISDGVDYTRNGVGDFIVPIGTITEGSVATGLELKSDMFPDAAQTYGFTARLMLASSNVSPAPSNGSVVASCDFELNKDEALRPALKALGIQVAKKTDWVAGREFNLSVDRVPAGGSVVVNAYRGLSGNDHVTDVLSSVGGVFDIDSGTGVYDSAKTQTGTLVLSSRAQPGTYRLVFEVKDADGQIVLTIPYYFVVR